MATSRTLDSAADRLADLDIGDAEWAASVPNLRSNLALLSADHVKLEEMLVEMGQSHVFEHWPELGFHDEEKRGFFDQLLD
ncbi:UDP-sugar pyrophosphorylase-like protein [Drosera capensis]